MAKKEDSHYGGPTFLKSGKKRKKKLRTALKGVGGSDCVMNSDRGGRGVDRNVKLCQRV